MPEMKLTDDNMKWRIQVQPSGMEKAIESLNQAINRLTIAIEDMGRIDTSINTKKER